MYQRQVSFPEAVNRAIKDNYCNFNGRASRSEFWWFELFVVILGFVISIASSFLTIATGSNTVGMVLLYGVNLALLLPSIGLNVRRLHDIGKSGWYIFLSFIPFVGVIILIVWYCKDSQPMPNEYGPVPNVVA